MEIKKKKNCLLIKANICNQKLIFVLIITKRELIRDLCF